MKSIVAAAVAATALLSASKAFALAEFGAEGAVWIEIEGSPGIEASVDYLLSGVSTSMSSGNADFEEVDDLSGGMIGVMASASGFADAPGGDSLVDQFILDVTFTVENTSGLPGSAPGQTGVFEGAILYDIFAEASITLLDEMADGFVSVVGDQNLPGAPSEFLFVTELEGSDSDTGLLADIGGALAPGEIVTYGVTIDLGGMAFSPTSRPGAEVPLPAAGLLMLSGLGALAATRRRRRA